MCGSVQHNSSTELAATMASSHSGPGCRPVWPEQSFAVCSEGAARQTQTFCKARSYRARGYNGFKPFWPEQSFAVCDEGAGHYVAA
jgi:hypothetical protein